MRACRLILHCRRDALLPGHRAAEGPPVRGGGARAFTGQPTAGRRWEWINRSHPLLWPKDFDVDPRDSRVIYLGAADARNEEGGLYKTSDGGATWTRIARKSSECFGATVHPRKPGWVYMCLTESARRCRALAQQGRREVLEGPRRPAVPEHPAHHLRPQRRLHHLRLDVRGQRLEGPGRAMSSGAGCRRVGAHQPEEAGVGAGHRLGQPHASVSTPGDGL